MWQPDGGLIQIELGNGIVKAFTKKVVGGLLGSFFDEEGDLLVESTQKWRKDLQDREGLSLPAISYRDNDKLQNNEVLAFYSLEIDRFMIQDTSEMLNYLARKAREYNLLLNNAGSVDNILSISLDKIRVEEYQLAYKLCSLGYSISQPQNDYYTMIRCLSDAGGIALGNGDLARATSLLHKAALLCNNPGIVDPIIKIQTGINFASVLRILGKHDDAISNYKASAHVAYYSANFPLLFLALIGLAETLCWAGNYARAIFALEQADCLLFSDEKEPNYMVSRNIHKTISEIKSIIINMQGQKLQQLESQLAHEKLKMFYAEAGTRIVSAIAQVCIEGVVCKLFGISGATCISLLGLYNFKGSSFTQSQIGNSNLMTNIERIVSNG